MQGVQGADSLVQRAGVDSGYFRVGAHEAKSGVVAAFFTELAGFDCRYGQSDALALGRAEGLGSRDVAYIAVSRP